MISNANFKLIVLGLLSVATYIQGRAVSSEQKDEQVEKIPDKLICDMIECPLNTYRCFVSKTNEEPSVLQRVNICFAEDKTILAQKNVSSPTDPNYRIREYTNSYRNGPSLTTTQQSEVKKINKQVNETIAGGMKNLSPIIKNVVKDIESQIQKQMKEWTETFNLLQVSGQFSKIALNMP